MPNSTVPILERSIGHVPMSGDDGSIALLADVTRLQKSAARGDLFVPGPIAEPKHS